MPQPTDRCLPSWVDFNIRERCNWTFTHGSLSVASVKLAIAGHAGSPSCKLGRHQLYLTLYSRRRTIMLNTLAAGSWSLDKRIRECFVRGGCGKALHACDLGIVCSCVALTSLED